MTELTTKGMTQKATAGMTGTSFIIVSNVRNDLSSHRTCFKGSYGGDSLVKPGNDKVSRVLE